MPTIFLAILLALITLLAISLNKTFHHLPIKELKRQAREEQSTARVLYRAAAYGASLQALLFVVIILSSAGSFVLLSTQLNVWAAFGIIVVLLWLGFLWLPSSRLTSFSRYLAVGFSPLLAWILRYTHAPLEKISRIIHDRYNPDIHTGIYDKPDLLELLHWQKEQHDSRITTAEIESAERALEFNDKLVRDIAVPRSEVVSVSAGEQISPVIIDELHKTGHIKFPVYEGKKDHIVGTLYLQDLIAAAQSSGRISSIMKRDVQYVHEDFSLRQVLDAFQKTKQNLFIVVNKFEEFVGTITIEDVMYQAVGQLAEEEFSQYDDLKMVAAHQLALEPKLVEVEADDGNPPLEPEPDPTPEDKEVIE